MIISMTGYGAARRENGTLAVAVEIRTLNNRYFKLSLRGPEECPVLEGEVDKLVRRFVRRGTINIQVRCERPFAEAPGRINGDALRSYIRQLEQAVPEVQQKGCSQALIGHLLDLPGVVTEHLPQSDLAEETWPLIAEALTEALEKLQEMRREEGQAMATELMQYADQIAERLANIEERIPAAIDNYRQRLFDRVRSALVEHDIVLEKADLIKEVSLYCERADIAEEVTRLSSHIEQFRTMVGEEESNGRKLDFLIQEMFRETNTIGAKASDIEISREVVEIKSLLEKCRELVQNIE